jgi:hypothetical protein
MEQRPLRLGDLVDDYCPRERRLTNHAIVAIVEQEIRQTRCTTCDAEHVYKGGKAPVRKKKDTTAALYDQVLANVTGSAVNGGAAVAAPPETAAPVAAAPPEQTKPAPAAKVARVAKVAEAEPVDPVPTPAAPEEPAAPEPPPVDEGWTLHRTLIRATLPRTDSQNPTPRAIPEFTMHQRNVRGSHMFRGGGQDSSGGFTNGNGSGHGRGGGFRGDSQPGSPSGQRPGGGRRRRRSKKPRPTN